ncbi:MAG: sugar phosphorylase [Hydrogenovibrio sp.]|uniref:sugar phosphorylase n=1 Tax=Hydrogenovibrio sp. TaxID=2065821 RepID=UPI00287093C5|nr:sugar phosphorylase [Hydrogenovibrio sp.]MDR9498683.1 sugar phosphorylase [Hydrogenovibrio sp.]
MSAKKTGTAKNEAVEGLLTQIQQRLERLYGETLAQQTFARLQPLLEKRRSPSESLPEADHPKWSQKDVFLITYGDTLYRDESGESDGRDEAPKEAPLETLSVFLKKYIRKSISHVHILPFFPYSSDDGFSVIDYTHVNPDLGDWSHIEQLEKSYDLMFDLVINHISRESLWFTDFKANQPPYDQFFIEMHGDEDVSKVTRPRNTPLLVPAYTHRGRKMVWATFSQDQIDLNFQNPEVLLRMLEVLLLYIDKGARTIRLDAIAFLWKELGTHCIHLPQTHEVVKLMRDVMTLVAPHSLLLTETNVPHAENLSYFGEQDEAHMVYQFALAPLLLHALHRGDGQYLTDWAQNLAPPPSGCTFLNFTASHDGIGLRPVEGILPQREVDDLITNMKRLGGFVTNKSNPDGSQSPYEINIALFSAFRETAHSDGPDQWQVDRFICSQNIMMTLQGIPAFYIHSMVATPNDKEGVERTGRTRSINRRRWPLETLEALIESGRTSNAEVLKRLTNILQRRKKHKAFHPDTPQTVLDLGPDFFALWRDGSGKSALRFPLLAIHNLTSEIKMLDLSLINGMDKASYWVNLLDNGGVAATETRYVMQPYQSVWLMPETVEDVSALWAPETD